MELAPLAIQSVLLALDTILINATVVQKIMLLVMATTTSINRVLRVVQLVIIRTTSTRFAVPVNPSAQPALHGITAPPVSMVPINLTMVNAPISPASLLNTELLDPFWLVTIVIHHVRLAKGRVNSIVYRASHSTSS